MSYESITMFLLFLGGAAVFWSYYGYNSKTIIPKKTKTEKMDNELYEEYGARIEELNYKILEINEYGGFLKGELDKKHKELLFLYQLIHEKTLEIKELKEQKDSKPKSGDEFKEEIPLNNKQEQKKSEAAIINKKHNNSRAIYNIPQKEKVKVLSENNKNIKDSLIGSEKNQMVNSDEEIEFNQLFNKELSRNENIKKDNTKTDNSYKQVILELSEKGYSIIEIAQMLDIGQGEVQLVLDLYE